MISSNSCTFARGAFVRSKVISFRGFVSRSLHIEPTGDTVWMSVELAVCHQYGMIEDAEVFIAILDRFTNSLSRIL